MQTVLEIHWAVGFLVVLCALVFSWNALGGRVMNVVVGLQILIGLVLAGLLGGALRALGATLALHVVLALIAVAAYGMSMAVRRKRGDRPALIVGGIGLVVVVATFAVGLHMGGHV